MLLSFLLLFLAHYAYDTIQLIMDNNDHIVSVEYDNENEEENNEEENSEEEIEIDDFLDPFQGALILSIYNSAMFIDYNDKLSVSFLEVDSPPPIL